MPRNKNGKLSVVLLLVTAILVSSSGVAGHKVVGNLSSATTDDEFEEEIADLLKQADGQQRRSLTYNAILAHVARHRAYDMGRRHYYGHENPDGLHFYDLIEQAGYEAKGSGECIMASSETATKAWNAWMNSPGHRRILLGLSSDTFFADHVEYGIGHAYVPGSRWGHYWVVIVAAPEKTNRSSPSTSEDSPEPEVNAGSSTHHPHVVRGANGRLRPASGYVWVDPDDPEDLRVKLMPGLIRTESGCLRPASGYRWVNAKDPNDLRVEPIP